MFQDRVVGLIPAAEEQAVSDLPRAAQHRANFLCISAFKTTPQHDLWRRDRVVGPILQLKNELFQTFRQRRSIVSVQEYETDTRPLWSGMLADFESDFAKSAKVLGSAWYLDQLCARATCQPPAELHSRMSYQGQLSHRDPFRVLDLTSLPLCSAWKDCAQSDSTII